MRPRSVWLMLGVLAVPAAGLAGDDQVARARELRSGAGEILASVEARGHATLDDCFRLALAASEDFGISAEQLRQSQLRLKAGWGIFLPSVAAEGRAFREQDVPRTTTGSSLGTGDASRTDLRIRLEQQITRFGAERAGIRELKRRAGSASWAFAEAGRQLYLGVATAYTEILSREREVTVRQETVRAAEDRLQEMEARQEVGLARRAELLAIRTQRSAEKAALEEATAALAIAREQLSVLLGLPVDVPLQGDLGAQDAPEALPERDGELDLLLSRRPDVRASQLAAEAALAHVGLVRSEVLPRASVAASYYVAEDASSGEVPDWDATLTLTIPLYNGGAGWARVAEARSLAEEVRLVHERTRREARLQARQAALRLRSDRARLATLEDGERHALESHALASEEYRLGISTNLDVETARTALRQARLDLERQRLRLQLDTIDLSLALGNLPTALAALCPEETQ